MPVNLRNFPKAWVSGKFPKCLAIWEISQISGFLGNFPNASKFAGNFLVFLKFPSGISRILGIWKNFQIPRNLGKSPDFWESREFPKFLFSPKV